MNNPLIPPQPSVETVSDAGKSAKFRRDAGRFFRLAVIALVLMLFAIMALGWWILVIVVSIFVDVFGRTPPDSAGP